MYLAILVHMHLLKYSTSSSFCYIHMHQFEFYSLNLFSVPYGQAWSSQQKHK